MRISVTKGERADRIAIERADGSTAHEVVPHKGPVAHDLVHYAVEQGLGFESGFWGLVAAGHDPAAITELAKAGGHASAKRAERPDPAFIQAIQVERIVESFEAELWSAGNDNDGLRAMSAAGCDQSLVPCPPLGDAELDRVRTTLRALADRWAGLGVGETLTLDWQRETA